MVCAVSAAGVYIPPMIIFKRKKFHADLKIGAPPASIVTISDTGYINKELFFEWLQHFQKHANCNIDNKVLLLLDGHTTHSKNLQACEFARKNGIIMLQLPGHTTHRLQPLDIAFFGPLQTYFTQAQETFLRLYKGDKIYQTQISKLLNEAYGRAATVGIAESAFRASGIWPVNRHIFTDDQFAPADVLQPFETSVETSSSDDDEDGSDKENNVTQNKNKQFKRLLEEISPRAKKNPHSDGPSSSRSAPMAQKAVEITSSLYKSQLEQKLNKIALPKVNKMQKIKTGDSWFCTLCAETKEEEMIQCLKCRIWIHTQCAGVSAKTKIFFCSNCRLKTMVQN